MARQRRPKSFSEYVETALRAETDSEGFEALSDLTKQFRWVRPTVSRKTAEEAACATIWLFTSYSEPDERDRVRRLYKLREPAPMVAHDVGIWSGEIIARIGGTPLPDRAVEIANETFDKEAAQLGAMLDEP